MNVSIFGSERTQGTFGKDDFVRLGDTHCGLGNYDRALTAYNNALRIFPNDVYLVRRKAEVLYIQGQYSESLRLLTGFLAQVKQDNVKAIIYANMGSCYGKLGAYGGALAYYSLAQKRDPNMEGLQKAIAQCNRALNIF